MQTPRQTARNSGYCLIVSIWQDEAQYTRGGDALRGATGVRSDGSIIELTDDWGHTYEYPPILDPGLEVPQFFSLIPRSVSVTFPWLRAGLYPFEFDLRNAVGEICLVDEIEGASGPSSIGHRLRWRLLFGEARGPASWGRDESVTITITEPPIERAGQDFWPPGAELTGARHADIDADTATYPRAIAPSSKGILTPLIYAPVGSSLKTPMAVVQDEVVPTYAARVFRISERAIALSTTQFFVVDDKNTRQFTDTATSSAYQATPSVMTDLLGTPYYGVVGNFQQSVGALVTFAASDTATVPQQRDKLGAGDVMRGSASGSDNDLEIVDNVSGDTVTLQAVYSGTAQTAAGYSKVVMLPPTRADCAYRSAALGGTLATDGTAISELLDVVIDWCRNYAQTSIPIAVGDLEGLRKRCQGMRLGFYLNARQSPWQRVLKALEMAPIRPYQDEGRIRFRWVGPVDPVEIVTTIDLDDDGITWRPGPVNWRGDSVFPIVESRYGWDSFKESYTGTLALDGTVTKTTDVTRVANGRAISSVGEWRKGRGDTAIPRLQLDLDMVETAVTAAGALTTALYLWGRSRRTLELQLDASYRWLKMGDRVYVIEHRVIPVSTVWQVESRSIPGSGLWRYVLEEVDGVPGARTRQPICGEREGELWGEG